MWVKIVVPILVAVAAEVVREIAKEK